MDNQTLDITHHRAIILGTGLVESLLSSALAYKAYNSVNIDVDISYSSSMKTCSMKEYRILFGEVLPFETNRSIKVLQYQDHMTEEEFKKNTRGYNIDLQPRFLYSHSMTVDKMIEAGMDKYMEFRAITGIYFLNEEKELFVRVPTTKGEIFASNEFSILDKRGLYKLLNMCSLLYAKFQQVHLDQNSISDFDKEVGLSEEEYAVLLDMRHKHVSEFLKYFKVTPRLAQVLVYIIANYHYNLQDSEKPEYFLSTELFIERVNKFIKSAGVHSMYPYLYTNYGTSDVLQGFSRSSAVYGSCFVVNRNLKLEELILQPDEPKEKFKLKTPLAGKNEYITSEVLVINKDYIPIVKTASDNSRKLEPRSLLRITTIIEALDLGLSFETPALYYIFPGHKKLNNPAPIFIFATGDKTNSAPEDRYILYAQTLIDTDMKEEDLTKLHQDILAYMKEILLAGKEYKELLNTAYLQIRRNFANEAELMGKDRLAVIEDDDFLLEFDEYYKKAEIATAKLMPENPEMLFVENFTRKTKEDIEIKQEKEMEAEEESQLNLLLDSLDKFKVVENKPPVPEEKQPEKTEPQTEEKEVEGEKQADA